jgi:RNA polymerase sigma factor (TIGR02999 family)
MGEVTLLLQRAGAGDVSAREPLYRLLYPELMRLARVHAMRAATGSLDAAGLLHEAYLRFAEGENLPDANRRLFFAYASKVMRSVAVDHARERGAQKRGGGLERVTLSGLPGATAAEHSAVDVEDAMSTLARVDERAFRVAEMRCFGGMTEQEIADVLELSLATVRRSWRRARAFLVSRLG